MDCINVVHREPVERLRALARTAGLHAARGDDDEVRAQAADLALDLALRAVADRDHHDHGADADDDAEHRERRAHLVLEDALQRHAEDGLTGHAATSSSTAGMASSAARSSAAMCRSTT